MKRMLSVLCALCIVAGTASCSENQKNVQSGNNTTSAVPPNETTSDFQKRNEESSSQKPATTTTSYSDDVVVMYTSGYTGTTEMEIVPAQTTHVSEAFTTGYDPRMPDIYFDIQTREIYPDTQQVTFSINSSFSVTTTADFKLERFTSNGFEEIKRVKNITQNDKVTITPDLPLVINLYPDDYGITFTRGDEYRISKIIDGKEYEIYFVVGDRIPPLKKGDIQLYISGADGLTVDNKKSLTLEYTYVGNAEYAQYGFGCDYKLEKLNEQGVFEPVEFSESAAFIDLGYLISTDYPTNSTTVYLNDDFYAEPLTAGTYKVIKPIDSSITLTGLFRINEKYNYTPEPAEGDLEMFVFQTEEDVPITEDTELIDVQFSFASGRYDYAEFMYGSEYSIEKLENGQWRVLPFNDNIGWDSVAYIIDANNPIPSFSIPLKDNYLFAEPFTKGKYRVKKTVSGTKDYYAEFEIISKSDIPTEYDYEIDSENGSLTLTINEMRADKLICSLPWPYPATYTVQCFADEYPDLCVGDTIEVEYAPMYKTGEWDYLLIPTSISPSNFQLDEDACYKPVIYLYPEEKTDVSVKLDYNGDFTVTYPEYSDGWNVTAMPDGTLYDEKGNEYSYLFWEGKDKIKYDFSEGFCVKGEDTAEFLREKLSLMGLTPREYNEFIVFWLPFMQDNKYNIISFQSDAYTDNAILTVTPEPDTVLRVFMAFKPSAVHVEIPEQELIPTERNGFTVVEWGGALS